MDRLFNLQHGFSLIELIMVIVIIGAISLILAPIIFIGIESWDYIHTRTDLINDARMAMHRMVREIRGAKQIDTNYLTDIVFTNVNDETVRFFQDEDVILRNEDELVENVSVNQGLQFKYYNTNGEETSDKEEVKLIKIKLILIKNNSEFSLQDKVMIRNME